MTDRSSATSIAVGLRERALSRWDNEGGAVGQGGMAQVLQAEMTPALSDAELIHLRVRVIALENIVIALLAAATGRQQDVASEMANLIRPRKGAAAHPLTLEAANLIDGLIRRSGHFADTTP